MMGVANNIEDGAVLLRGKQGLRWAPSNTMTDGRAVARSRSRSAAEWLGHVC